MNEAQNIEGMDELLECVELSIDEVECVAGGVVVVKVAPPNVNGQQVY